MGNNKLDSDRHLIYQLLTNIKVLNNAIIDLGNKLDPDWKPPSTNPDENPDDKPSSNVKAELEEDITSNVVIGATPANTKFNKGLSFTNFVKKIATKDIIPAISFSITNSGIKELGTIINGSVLTCNINTIGSFPINKIEFYKGSTIINTQTFKSGTTRYTYTVSDKISSNVSFKVRVYYNTNKYVDSGIASITFILPTYYGVVTDIVSGNGLDFNALGLSKTIKNSKGYTFNNINLDYERVCYAIPTSLGSLSSIKDANNFEYIASYTKNECTDNNGNRYYVYTLTEPVTINGFKQIFA